MWLCFGLFPTLFVHELTAEELVLDSSKQDLVGSHLVDYRADTTQTWRFGVFEVDARKVEVRRSGTPLKMREQSFRILLFLLEHAGEIVTREELRTVLWPSDTFVDFDHSLNTAMMKLRDALGDSAEEPIYIETIPKRGYRFIAPAVQVTETQTEPASRHADSDSAVIQGEHREDEAAPGAMSANGEAANTEPPLPAKIDEIFWAHALRLDEIPTPVEPVIDGGGRASARRHRFWKWMFTGAGVLAVGLAATTWYLLRAPKRVLISDIAPPEKSAFVSDPDEGSPPVLSPDGNNLVFVAQQESGKQMLWLRALNREQTHALAGTDGAMMPFWSPDGSSIAFFAAGKMDRLDIASGTVQKIATVPYGRGGTWNADDTILFSPNASTPLYRVSAAGGDIVQVTSLDESHQEYSHRWPQFLPDGKHFLYFAVCSLPDYEGTYVSSLDGGKPKLLLPGNTGAVYASGHLLFVRQGTLMAQPFDVAHLTLSGEARPLMAGVASVAGAWKGIFSASNNGVLAYYPGDVTPDLPINIVNRSGQILKTLPEPGQTPSVSPDGRLIVMAGPGGLNGDLWVYDIARGVVTRITTSPEEEDETARPAYETSTQIHAATFPAGRKCYPVWSPDGKHVAFSWNRDPGFGIYEKAADGTGPIQTLLKTTRFSDTVSSWSRDGRYIAYELNAEVNTGPRQSVWALPLFGDRKPFPVVQGDFNAVKPQISPDSHWLAYVSDESGKPEVYLTSFPAGKGKWQVSASGGDSPRWRGDGHELYFVSADNQLTAVQILTSSGSPKIGKPRPLFAVHPPLGNNDTFYDVMPDGQTFVMESSQPQGTAHFTLIVNWPTLLAGK